MEEKSLKGTLSLKALIECGFAPLAVGSSLGRVLFQPLILAADDTRVTPEGGGQGAGHDTLPMATEPKSEL